MTSAGREVLKWLALVLMTGDHVNKVLLHEQYPWLTDVARVVFPIFAIVLAYNLAQHPSPDATRRALVRMLVFAVLTQPFHAWAFGYWVPLNVLFTLALGVYVATAANRWLSVIAWLMGGAVVDYEWFGVAVVVAGFYLWRISAESRSQWVIAAALMVAAVAALYAINGNLIALGAIPLLWMVGRLPGSVARCKWLFLAYYVIHLAVLVAIDVSA
ncbi:TraX family protein [Pseudoxanthomonas indica]|uniref:TraX protein n=1 Tax=Pseudoxanthomonas indica TaxID=428993 RepID=A0A1T5IJP4_9GAMM|nr:TraX family protein [Pseudoxanthomonas indica]GGD52503.1 hypothetical protein GCM10007235_25890 [Pseudoxanthomonas indica]SKC39248.1 TraX protein [Pseudoxanthomonas indica]